LTGKTNFHYQLRNDGTDLVALRHEILAFPLITLRVAACGAE
jgi:hypothetical protein